MNRFIASLASLALGLTCFCRLGMADPIAEPNTTTPADAVVTFNEIMYHPSGDNADQEWIELYNQMSINIDLSNWRIEGAIDFQFPTNTVLKGNSYVVVAANPALLQTTRGATNVFGPFNKRLSNSGETLRLRNNNSRLMDEMSYTDEYPWPVSADGSGASLAKRGKFLASSPGVNWRGSLQAGGTPGTENFPATQTQISQNDQFIHAASQSRWFIPADDSLGTSWTEPGFDDSNWNVGTASLGYDVGIVSSNEVPAADRVYALDGSVADSTENAVNGQNMGAVFSTIVPAALRTGQSLKFDGISSFVEVSDPVSPSAYTIALWVEVDQVRASSLIVRTDASGPRVNWSHQLRINDAGQFEHYLYDGSARTVTATNIVHPGVWYHLVATASNGGEMAIFVNGVSSGEPTTISSMWTGGDRWRLGTDSGPSANFFNGRLDEVAIWEKVLDPASIQHLASGALPAKAGGYRNLFQTDVQSALFQKNSSLFARISFTPEAGVAYDQLSLDIFYADGFVGYLNGTEVARRNAPPIPGWNSLATVNRADSDAAAQETIDLSAFVNKLKPGPNVFSFQALNSSANDPEFLLSAELSGRQASIGNEQALVLNEISAANDPAFFVEILNPSIAEISLENCRMVSSSGGSTSLAGRILLPGSLLALHTDDLGFNLQSGDTLFLLGPAGNAIDAVKLTKKAQAKSNPAQDGVWLHPSLATPGEVNQFSLRNEIVINEIMYHPPPIYRTPTNDYAEIGEQWVELYNRSAIAVDLGGWSLDGDISFAFPAGTIIAADSYVVISGDAAGLRIKYPDINIMGDFAGKLSHHAGRIVLRDDQGNPANEVTYYNEHPWPEYPNGGGSSLELRDPRGDNSVPESWAASIESSKTSWRHYSYRAKAIAPVYSPAIYFFNEFRLGLLNDGEALFDNINVVELPGTASARQLLQNTNFTAGTSKWRLLGNHSHSFAEPDPDDPSNSILHLISTGPASYLDNRLETTLKIGASNVPVVTGHEYEISFDAKWIAGSPQVHSELYYDKVAATTILDTPQTFGTPGKRNSTFMPNAGPTFHFLQHSPVVPKSAQNVNVSITAEDPDGVAALNLKYAVNGGVWKTAAMSNSAGVPAVFTGIIPSQANGSVIQFYVEGIDNLDAVSTYPAGGTTSRALIKVDGTSRIVSGKQTFRTIMTSIDSNHLHAETNLMSDDLLGCTVIHNEQEVFYDARIRLHGSMFSRDQPDLTGFAVKFPADHLFRGSRASVIVRRRGMVETFAKHILNEASGLPANYDDIIYFVSHRSDNLGNARLNLANYDDTYIDSQFEQNNGGTVFKLEGIREYQTTDTGTAEGYKLSQPIGWIQTYDIANLGTDPEQYRWGIMIQSQRARDDYSRIVAMGKAFSLSGTALHTAALSAIDVDEWARLFALQTLLGIQDVYGVENPHNFAFYARPDDGRVVGLQNDWEFAFSAAPTASIYGSKNVYKVLNLPGFRRLYQGHLLDLMNSVCNGAYLTPWAAHFSVMTGESYTSVPGYLNSRDASVRKQLAAQIPFEITSNGGADFSVETPNVVLQGLGWIDVHEIRQTGVSNTLDVAWLDDSHWQIDLPLKVGTNLVDLTAFNFRGLPVGHASITVATTTAEFPERDYLRVSELMYHPADPSPTERNAGFSNSDDFEFIELLNTGAVNISLEGVRLTDGVTFDFSVSAITNLLPGKRVLVVKNIAAFEARYGTNLPVAGSYSGSFNNAGETIRLEDALSFVIQEFFYGDSGDWPIDADGFGRSLEPISFAGDYNDPANWRTSTVLGGTPGASSVALPNFVSVAVSGSRVVFVLEAAPMQQYTIYHNSNLAPESWQVLKVIPPQANSHTEEISDSISADRQFYRVSTP